MEKMDCSEVESAFEFAKFVEGHEAAFNYDIPNSSFVNTKEIYYHTALASQRDVLNNILVMEAATTMCLVLASRRGNVSLVSGSCLSQSVGPSYQLPVSPGGQPVTGSQSRGCSWLCDAVIMPDAKTIVYALSDRSLHFYDTACSLRSDAVQEHRHLWRVVGLPHSITCLCYHQGVSPEPSVLFMGDEQGSVTTFIFLQPSTVLFQRRGLEARPGLAEAVYWPELLKSSGLHAQYVQVKTDKRIHSEGVLQMIYYHDQQTIISCSLDTKKSLILWHKNGKMPSYTFSIDEGVRCFSFSSHHHQLATGSDDGIVRLWNPLVIAKPTACLSGHEATVIDVLYATNQELLFSLCKFAELRLWNAKHLFCLQNIHLTPPLTQHWAAPRSLVLWRNNRNDGVLIALGPNLAEIHLNAGSSATESRTSNSMSQDLSSCDDPKPEDVLGSAASSSSDSSPREALTNPLQIPEMNLNLDKMPRTTFTKPQFPPSALEVLKFSEDEEEGSYPAGMNERIEGQARILAQRRQLVEQCAPHLALTLWPPAVLVPPVYHQQGPSFGLRSASHTDKSGSSFSTGAKSSKP